MAELSTHENIDAADLLNDGNPWLLHVPQGRGAILTRLCATERGIVGAWTGNFTTCVIAVVIGAHGIGLVHADQTTELQRFLPFVADAAKEAGSGATVHLIFRPEHLERVMKLTENLGPHVSAQAHSNLTLWLWGLHKHSKSLTSPAASMTTSAAIETTAVITTDAKYASILEEYAPEIKFHLVPCQPHLQSVSVTFSGLRVPAPCENGENGENGDVMWSPKVPPLSHLVLFRQQVNLHLHGAIALTAANEDNTGVNLFSSDAYQCVFAPSARLLRHPQEYKFMSVTAMEYILRGYYFGVTGRAVPRSVMPVICMYRDGWMDIPENESFVTGSRDQPVLVDLFSELDALPQVTTRLCVPVMDVIRKSLQQPGVLSPPDPSHLMQSVDTFIFYFLLWKHGPTFQQCLREVQSSLMRGLDSSQQAFVAFTMSCPAEQLTFKTCGVILALLRQTQNESIVADFQLDVRRFAPFVVNQTRLLQLTQKFLQLCRDGSAAFASALKSTVTSHKLMALQRVRVLYQDASRLAHLSQVRGSVRISKVESNLARVCYAIAEVHKVSAHVPLSAKHPAGLGGASLQCRHCKRPATFGCEACKGGTMYCSKLCQTTDAFNHSAECAQRCANPDMFTSGNESLVVFSNFFQKYPNARLKLDKLLRQPMPGTIALIQETKPDADPLVMPWSMTQQAGLVTAQSMESIRELVTVRCKSDQQTVMLILANGVFYTNCLSV